MAQPRLKELCDAFSYHNYSADPAVTRRNIERIRAKMREAGWERPIWNGTAPTASRPHIARRPGILARSGSPRAAPRRSWWRLRLAPRRGSRRSILYQFIEHGAVDILRKKHGLTAASAVEKILPHLIAKKPPTAKSVA